MLLCQAFMLSPPMSSAPHQNAQLLKLLRLGFVNTSMFSLQPLEAIEQVLMQRGLHPAVCGRGVHATLSLHGRDDGP